RQLAALRQVPHIIIATPGRLNDHLETVKLDLSKTAILVLDEADRMLDMGFAPQIKKILQRIPRQRQTMLFSATMPDEIVKIAHAYMSLPLRVEVAPSGTAVSSVTQEIYFAEKSEKTPLLQSVLSEYKGSVLVFSRTKYGAKKITRDIRHMGHTAAEIHSNRSLGQRKEALEGFKIGRYRVLVATDIASRGIDVTGIELVLNYDLPATAEDYVHRIGRTARAGMAGHAISFVTSDQRGDVRNIERLIRKSLPVSKSPISGKTFPQAPAKSQTAYFPEAAKRQSPFGRRASGGRRSRSYDRRKNAPHPNRHTTVGGEGGYFMTRRHNNFSR
ncbi:MAG: DEAD/DEAH box helicase, partial [Patescibacteria group bacterium]